MSGSPEPTQYQDTLAEAIADHTVNKLITRLSDEETVDKIVVAWSGVLDKFIGRGVRRVLWTVLGAIAIVAAFKLDLFGAFERFMKG